MSESAANRGIFRVAGVSAFIFVVMDVVALALMMSIMPGRFVPVEEWLSGIQANKFLYGASIGAFIVGDLFLVPFLLGLYLSLRPIQKTYALFALALGATSIPMILLDNLLAYSLIRLVDGLAAATSAAGKAAIVATADSIFLASSVAFILFYTLLGLATIIFSLAMLRGRFPRWLGWLGIPAGVLIASGMLLTLLMDPAILSLFEPGWILFVVWLVVAGIQLLRL